LGIHTGPLTHDHCIQVFSREEIGRRRQILLDAMNESDLDAVLVHTADHVLYLSGIPLLSEWGRPMWMVLKRSGEGALIGAAIEQENMNESYFDETLPYADAQNVVNSALDLLTGFVGTARRIGVETGALTVRLHVELGERFPGAQQVDISRIITDARLIKSEEELQLLRIGGEVAKIGASAFLDILKEGVSELAITSHAVAEMNRATAALCPAALSSTYSYSQLGLRTLTPHLHAGGRRARRGDIVGLNVFPVLSGYCIELERTFVLGGANAEQQRALDAATLAFDTAKGMVAPGVLHADVDAAATEILVEAGFGDFIRHGTGHAHGIMIGSASREEGGELRSYNSSALQPGMICSVEPAVFLPGVGAFRHSDVLIVTETGSELITAFEVSIQH
jgi:Xaa-Pro aminopeptidase